MSLDTGLEFGSFALKLVDHGLADPTPDIALETFTEVAREVTDGAVAHLSLSRPIRGRQSFTSPNTSLSADDLADALEEVANQVYQTGRPVMTSKAQRDTSLASCLAVPVGGTLEQPIGVLVAGDTAPRRWTSREIETLALLASFLGTQLSLCLALEFHETQHHILLHEVQARRSVERELLHKACTDALTGLSNRWAFERAAEIAFDQAAVEGPISVIMIDLDEFKGINDSHGHEAGDIVLSATAARIRSGIQARPAHLARLGGEEFAAVLPGLAPVDAIARAEQCRAELEGAQIWLGSGEPIQITASFGVAPVLAEDCSINAALTRADRALYTAKAKGRNQVVAW